MGISRDDCQLIFAGVNFVFSPGAEITSERQVGFQAKLIDRQMEFDQIKREGSLLLFIRSLGSPLQVQVVHGAAPVGQLLVLADNPQYPLAMIEKEMDQVVAAFEDNWGTRQQVVARDATIRLLFPVSGPHAFQYLWEQRLGQAVDALQGLGRPVLGGGLRLVMPPVDEKFQIELKVESFLRDTSKLFLEVQFLWQEPEMPGVKMHPDKLIRQVYDYACGQALDFAAGNE